jgi:hypothetical protein
MRTALMCAMLVFWSGTIFAQDPAAPPPSRNGASMQLTELPSGVAMAAELSKSIDARKAKTGDRIEAKTTQDMLSNGKIVIPHDSKITGHITESQGRAKGQKGDSTSSLGIAFDTLTLKGGQEIPLHAEIQAIAKPVQVVPNAAGTETPGGGTLAGGGYPGASPQTGAGAAPGSNPGSAPTNPSSTQQPGSEGGNAPDHTAGPMGVISVQNQGVVGMKGFSLNSNDQECEA